MKKILDYTNHLEGFMTKIHEKVLWPVNEYIIGVQDLPNFGDNEVESLLLRLSAEGIRDSNELSKLTGLEADFISFVQNRLHHKGFFDEFMCLTENGKAKLEQKAEKEEQYFSIFQDAVSGKLLVSIQPSENQPEIKYTEFENEESENVDSEISYFRYKENSTLGDEEIEPKKIPMFLKKSDLEPTSEEIKSLFSKLNFPSNVKIEIKNKVENDVYLVVDLMVLEGDDLKWMTTDGFGDLTISFAPEFGLLSFAEQNYIKELRKKAQRRYAQDTGFYYKKTDEWNDYPRIGQYLSQIQDLIPKVSAVPKNSNELNELHENKIESIKAIYNLLEWLFFYKANENLIEVKQALSEINDFEERTQVGRIARIAIKDKLGFSLPETLNEKFNVKPGSIKGSVKKDGNHELFSLFILNALIAKNDSEHWMNKIVEIQNDLPAVLCELKQERDNAEHTHETEITAERIKEYFAIIKKIIENCFERTKEISVVKNDEKQQLKIYESIQKQKKEDSVVWIERKFDFAVLNSIPNDFMPLLLNLGNACTEDKTNGKINPIAFREIYTLFEKIFYMFNQKTVQKKYNSDFYENLKSIAKNNGFDVSGDYKALKNTKEDFIKKALEKYDMTLQADFIAWILTESSSTLTLVAKNYPNLMKTVIYVCDLRGHSDIPSSSEYKEEDLKEVVEGVVEIIRIFSENGYFYRR